MRLSRAKGYARRGGWWRGGLSIRIVLTVALLALLVSPFLVDVGNATPTAQTFSNGSQLPLATGFGEPSIAVAPDGTLYVAAPGSHTAVWRSDNGGQSWGRVHDTPGASGDSDVAVDADGTLYASDLFDNVPVSVSHDQGATWSVSRPTLTGSIDRQWLAAHGHGNVWSTVRDGSTERIAISHDAGITWTTRVVVPSGVSYQGNILATSDTDLWIPYTTGSELRLAKSHDAGLTWTTSHAGSIFGGSVLFPAVAVDAAGTVYVLWAQDGDSLPQASSVRIVQSHDGGDTFGLGVKVLSDPGTYNLFPWLVADAAGHVEAAWLEGAPVGGTRPLDENVATDTSWYVKTAYTSDGSSWTSQRATPNPVHTGPICNFGTLCAPIANPVALNRQILDFFEMAERPDGNVVISYVHDTAALAGTTRLEVIRQTGGPNLK